MYVKCQVGPSILNSDLSTLSDDCRKLINAGADFLHLDIMDGHFVPNISFGPSMVAALRRKFPHPIYLDVHMMVTDPLRWVADVGKAGANQYTFHFEATADPMSVIKKIEAEEMKVGLAIKPATPISSVVDLLTEIDVLLVMTVEPGFGGQQLIPATLEKVREARRLFPRLEIEIDGGVGPTNIDQCCEAGATMIVSGTSIVKASNPESAMNYMRERGNKILLEKYLKVYE